TRAIAYGTAVVVVVVACTSYVSLFVRAHGEAPKTLREAPAELAVVNHDAIWLKLPRGARVEEQRGAERPASGDRLPPREARVLGTERGDHDALVGAVSAADATGWTLRSASCFPQSWSATFAKRLTVGDAELHVLAAEYLEGALVTLTVETPPAAA